MFLQFKHDTEFARVSLSFNNRYGRQRHLKIQNFSEIESDLKSNLKKLEKEQENEEW